ncbi:MAG: class I SAM-dependent methyltransferase [Hyphomicrobiales bacterium]|nr:class I SAM-dependent methyltransferase [Hyphomicrobiales bacterium]MCP5370183.1 class I SAM-dependent methyltransferase [Hyphomicrobiales bacterium]
MADRQMRRERRACVAQARGTVLDVGIGTGLNLPWYDPGRVTRVIGVEPSAGMLRRAGWRAAQAPFAVDLRQAGAEDMPVDDASVDTAVITWTLCTIPLAHEALCQVRRVLKPGGRLIFVEHGRAADPAVASQQDLFNPLWRRLAGGCNLNRPIDELIAAADFRFEALTAGYLSGPVRAVRYTYRGVAVAR